MKRLVWLTALRYGWSTARENLTFLIIVTLIVLLAGELFPLLISESVKHDKLLSAIVLVLSLILQNLLFLGFVKISLKITKNERATYGDLFSCLPQLIPYTVASVLYALLVLLGLVLFIVPGIYFLVRYGFFTYFIVDKGAGIMESFRLSSEITRGYKTELLKLCVVLVAIMMLGALLVMVGLLVAVPVTMLCLAYAYRRLAAKRVVTASRTSHD